MLYKYSTFQEGFTEEISVTDRQECHIDHIMFSKGLISKIVICAYKFDERISVHISLHMGNLKLATIVTYEDFVIEYRSLGNEKDHCLTLCKAKDYDK
ncbi:MAG: hypothetical protein ABFD25_20895 [Clostridiaceae bacterium]